MPQIDTKALFSLSYGLFVLTSGKGENASGCIVNTVSQLSSDPLRICVYVNRQNHTNKLICETGMFNASVLAQSAPFSLFEHFGYQSGRDVNKFAGRSDPTADNGLYYINENACALLSAKVIDARDYGTHTLFVADVTEARVLSSEAPLTYADYFAHVKPKPQPQKKRGYVCKICGYFHEGDELPEDFVCPICKHGAADFEPSGF